MKTKTEKFKARKRVASATSIFTSLEHNGEEISVRVRFGVVATPEGYVKVLSRGGMTSLSFMKKGSRYRRILTGRPMYTKRGLSTIAHRFIKEVK